MNEKIRDRPQTARLLALAANEFDVSVEEIIGRSRQRNVLEARFAAIWLITKATSLSSPQIALSIGNRDHTTILSAVRSCERKLEHDPTFASAVRSMLKRAPLDPRLSNEAIEQIEIIADKIRDAVADRLREIAARDGYELARQLVPEIFGGDVP